MLLVKQIQVTNIQTRKLKKFTIAATFFLLAGVNGSVRKVMAICPPVRVISGNARNVPMHSAYATTSFDQEVGDAKKYRATIS